MSTPLSPIQRTLESGRTHSNQQSRERISPVHSENEGMIREATTIEELVREKTPIAPAQQSDLSTEAPLNEKREITDHTPTADQSDKEEHVKENSTPRNNSKTASPLDTSPIHNEAGNDPASYAARSQLSQHSSEVDVSQPSEAQIESIPEEQKKIATSPDKEAESQALGNHHEEAVTQIDTLQKSDSLALPTSAKPEIPPTTELDTSTPSSHHKKTHSQELKESEVSSIPVENTSTTPRPTDQNQEHDLAKPPSTGEKTPYPRAQDSVTSISDSAETPLASSLEGPESNNDEEIFDLSSTEKKTKSLWNNHCSKTAALAAAGTAMVALCICQITNTCNKWV